MATSISSASVENGVAYINGRVWTVNTQQAWAEAFIVGPDGRFTAVGSTAEIESIANKDFLAIYDLRGQFVMPGIHDAHVHILMSAIADNSHIRLPDVGITGATLAEELKKGKCLCQYAHVNQDWLIAHTYVIEDFDRAALDKEFPETPVIVNAGAGHSMYLNSQALKRCGYSIESEPDGQGTRFLRDSHGHLTGEFAENSMSKAVLATPAPSLAHIKRTLKTGIARLHAAGVTSCQDAAISTVMLQAFGELDAENALKIDIQAHIVYAPDWIAGEPKETLHKTLDEAEKYKSTHVDTRFVKIILDGVPLPPYYTHAALKEDGQVDSSKLLITNVAEAVRTYDAKGMTIKIHCTGHGSTRIAMDAFEAVRKTNPNGPRHEIAHNSGVHDDEYKRFKPLNVTAEMSPAFFFDHPVTSSSGGLMDWNFPKMLAADAHMTIGSDWGAGADPDILPCVARVVEKIGDGDRKLGGQRLCRMMTLAGAEAVDRDREMGSIQVGKKANFIAVDKNLAEGEFDGANVLTTWFEGEIVFERKP